MRIALGQRIVSGPWGGGNRFLRALAAELVAHGHEVFFALDSLDLDIILLTDPRRRNPAVTITLAGVLAYLERNPRCLVVHRINECDERKGTWTMNARLRVANALADHTVFISHWLTNLAIWNRDTPASVIPNGADASVFHGAGHRPWNRGEPFRLVTHHWGSHANKGFDVYEHLARLMDTPKWRDHLELTYIGNAPPEFQLGRVRRISPLDDADLADELRRHHGYVTASINEPAGMHHIEGAMCGLPLLYRASGALPEYCGPYGEVFSGPEDVEEALERMMANYDALRSSLTGYPFTAQRMCSSYGALFADLVAWRSDIPSARSARHHPILRLLARLPL
jgi:glycosyltransferase involved in cell wall biosynthesis